jgi:hypothetical protein
MAMTCDEYANITSVFEDAVLGAPDTTWFKKRWAMDIPEFDQYNYMRCSNLAELNKIADVYRDRPQFKQYYEQILERKGNMRRFGPRIQTPQQPRVREQHLEWSALRIQ